MIVRFQVVRKDTKAPIQGAKVTLEKGESVGITDAEGVADIVTYWSGNLIYSVEAVGFSSVGGTTGGCVYPACIKGVELGVFVAPPLPPPGGEQVIGSIGTSCDLMQKSMFGRTWYSYRQRYTGAHWTWDSERGDAEYYGGRDPACSAPPPPPPKTVAEVSKDVDILRGTIQGVSSRIQDLATSLSEGFVGVGKRIDELQKGLDGIWDKLDAWLVERIVGLMLRALDREVEAKK